MLVVGSHTVKAPATIMYASAMLRETDRIILMIAALNDLEVKSGDILNLYIRHLLQKMRVPLWVLSLIKMLERLQGLLEHYMT